MSLRLIPCLALVLIAACSAGAPTATQDLAVAPDQAAPPDLVLPADLAWNQQLVADRPYMSKAPASYDKTKPTPLVLALHGFGDSGANLAQGLGLLKLADAKGFLVAYPNGTPTGFQGNYWNANEVCCQLTSPTPDDVAYLGAVIGDMSQRYNVDPARVFVLGLSNGGMMAHRLACDLAGRVAAVVSISGAQFYDEARCQPSRPVAALEIHGTKDASVPYDGGKTLNGSGPEAHSAHATIKVWVDRDGCGAAADTSAPPVDLDSALPGDETTIEKWTGCKPGGAAELWTVAGGAHVPQLTAPSPALIYDWLNAHAR